jgi:4-amino-4-deoxy-L-arabinose transferase-like glycosyltransferase
MRLRPIATACVLAGIALLIYAFRLSAAPLSPAEVLFNAQAETGSAANTPLFFHAGDAHWLQPAAVYANAAARAIGGEELSGRIASALAGAISVALVFLIADAVTGLTWISIVAAVFLILTPAYWSFAQLGTDAIIPVPFLLLWLLNVLRFLKSDSVGALAVGGAVLGLSVYTHPAAPLTAMFLWILTLAVARRRNVKRLVIATTIFAAAWLPAATWFVRHVDAYPDTFGRWFVFAAHLRNPLDGFRAFINPGTLGNRASMYWGFWDPSWLFFSTQDATAPLLLIAAPFIALGVVRAANDARRDVAALLIGTALLPPLAGATFGVPHYLADAVVVLPVLALLSALGVAQLVRLAGGRPLEDHVAVAAVDGWHDHDAAPRA